MSEGRSVPASMGCLEEHMANATHSGLTRRRFLTGVGTTTAAWPLVTTLRRDVQPATASLGEGQSVRPTATREQIQQGISGNLCRCAAYNHILDAALAAASKMGGQ